MAWRLHLTNHAIQRLDLLVGQTPLLGVWSQRDQVYFYEADTGIPVGERTIESLRADDRESDEWQGFVSSLSAPNKAYFPFVHTRQVMIYTTSDGKMRLYHLGDTDLYLDIDGREISLDVSGDAGLIAVGLDRFLGLIAAVDDKGLLHIYQQNVPIGVFDVEISVEDQVQTIVAVPSGGASIYISDGQQIVITDSSGKVKKRVQSHYPIGQMACSPNGKLLATSDADSGVIRVYNGSDLIATHQRHAIDLMAEATQVQLLANLPPSMTAPSALAINDKKIMAFSMSGVVCVTALNSMDALPRPQRLL